MGTLKLIDLLGLLGIAIGVAEAVSGDRRSAVLIIGISLFGIVVTVIRQLRGTGDSVDFIARATPFAMMAVGVVMVIVGSVVLFGLFGPADSSPVGAQLAGLGVVLAAGGFFVIQVTSRYDRRNGP